MRVVLTTFWTSITSNRISLRIILASSWVRILNISQSNKLEITQDLIVAFPKKEAALRLEVPLTWLTLETKCWPSTRQCSESKLALCPKSTMLVVTWPIAKDKKWRAKSTSRYTIDCTELKLWARRSPNPLLRVSLSRTLSTWGNPSKLGNLWGSIGLLITRHLGALRTTPDLRASLKRWWKQATPNSSLKWPSQRVMIAWRTQVRGCTERVWPWKSKSKGSWPMSKSNWPIRSYVTTVHSNLIWWPRITMRQEVAIKGSSRWKERWSSSSRWWVKYSIKMPPSMESISSIKTRLKCQLAMMMTSATMLKNLKSRVTIRALVTHKAAALVSIPLGRAKTLNNLFPSPIKLGLLWRHMTNRWEFTTLKILVIEKRPMALLYPLSRLLRSMDSVSEDKVFLDRVSEYLVLAKALVRV